MKLLILSILLFQVIHSTFGVSVDNLIDSKETPKTLGDLLKDGYDTVFKYTQSVTVERVGEKKEKVQDVSTEVYVRKAKDPHQFILQERLTANDSGILTRIEPKDGGISPFFIITVDPSLPYGIKEIKYSITTALAPPLAASVLLYGLASRSTDLQFMMSIVKKYEPVTMELTSKNTELGVCKVQLVANSISDEQVSFKAMINRKTCGNDPRGRLQYLQKEQKRDAREDSNATANFVFDKATGRFLKGNLETNLHVMQKGEPLGSMFIVAHVESAGFKLIEEEVDESLVTGFMPIKDYMTEIGLY